MADAIELALDVRGGHHVAIGERAEVELYARVEAPLERHLVDRERAFAGRAVGVIHGRVEMVRRIEVVPLWVLAHRLHCPAFTIGQVRLREPGKNAATCPGVSR